MHLHRPWLLLILIGFSLILLVTLNPAQANAPSVLLSVKNALQGGTIALISPSTCPAGGCAPGQRLGMKFEFPLADYDVALEPNVKVCIYTPDSWNLPLNAINIDSTGEIPDLTYAPSDCNEIAGKPLTGYTMNSARQASLKSNVTIDSLQMSFSLPATAAGSHRVIARVLVRRGDTWEILTTSNSQQIPLVAQAGPFPEAFVANDANGCGSRTPCYINSSGDLVGGTGTGLKDAIDAVADNGMIYILGNYSIKGNTVNVQRPLTLTSPAGSPGTITFTGPENDANCAGAMLSLSSNVTVSGLTINDGVCTTRHRTLIEINNPPSGDASITIESNTLINGDNGLLIHNFSGAVQAMYNHITGNAGHSVFWDGSTRGGSLNLIANNLYGNGSGIECASDAAAPVVNRRANHNYFGAAVPPAGFGHCTFDPAKRLGAPIALKAPQPGVNAHRVKVTGTRPEVANNPFGSQLSYLRSGTDSQDFDLYIVDHGFATEEGLPFTLSYGRSPGPCSNYYDFFLPEGASPQNTTLELFFNYNKSIDCTAAINSSSICRAITPTPDLVPVFWYDVAATAAPTAWSSSMQRNAGVEGQVTTCDPARRELRVVIDAVGRPNLLTDLFYTPIMAGVPVIQSFKPLAYDKSVRVLWDTNAEPDVKEYYLMRGDTATSLSVIDGPFTSVGSATGGSSYNRWDYNKVNGQVYYYRLKVVRKDGHSFYSEVYPIAPNTPTSPPPPTITPTFTITPIPPTRTPTFTLVPPSFPTRVPTLTQPAPNRSVTPSQTPLVLPTIAGTLWTATPLPFLTGTPGEFPTETPTASLTFGPEGSPTPSLTATLPPRQGTGTAIAMLRSQTPAATRRPTRTATPTELAVAGVGIEQPGWLSLVLGLLAGTAVTGGLASAWWYLRTRR